MTEGPDEETIAGLNKMLRNTTSYTGMLTRAVERCGQMQSSISETLREETKGLSETLEEARADNATAFELRTEATERALRTALDNAFRAQQSVLKRLLKLPPR